MKQTPNGRGVGFHRARLQLVFIGKSFPPSLNFKPYAIQMFLTIFAAFIIRSASRAATGPILSVQYVLLMNVF